MKSSARFGVIGLAVVLGLVFSAKWVLAQDPVQVGPNIYKRVAFENERVRVCDIEFKPGDKIAMHSHPDHFVYVLSPGKLRLSYPDGTSKEMEAKEGDVVWVPAESHAGENIGDTDFKAIVVELKE